MRIRIKFHGQEHVGLGSKTAVSLATLTAASAARSVRVSNRELQRLCGRGGGSGVGIHGFFVGGFLADAGHKGRLPLLPSAQQAPTSAPTLILRIGGPDGWCISLFLPQGVRMSGDEETNFFRRVTPVPKSEIFAQIGLAYQTIVPAIIEDDLEQFGAALASFSTIGLKGRDI